MTDLIQETKKASDLSTLEFEVGEVVSQLLGLRATIRQIYAEVCGYGSSEPKANVEVAVPRPTNRVTSITDTIRNMRGIMSEITDIHQQLFNIVRSDAKKDRQ